MATAVSRRIATGVLAGLVLVPSGLLLTVPAYADDPTPAASAPAGIGEPAYAEATPDPVTGLYPGQAAPATDSSPATPGWITGETLQDGKGTAKPATKPVAKPAVGPVARPAAAPRPAPVRVTRQTPTPAGPRARTTSPSTSPAGGATVLPFTGSGRLEAQLGLGAGLVLVGVYVMIAARPRSLA